MSSINKIILLICCLLVFSHSGYSQDNEFKTAYTFFKEQVKQDYSSFRDRANRAYSDFVRQTWKMYQTLPAIPKPKDETNPPQVIPKNDEHREHDGKEVPFEKVTPVIERKEQPVPSAPIKEQPVLEENVTSFMFYGLDCTIRLSESNKFKLSNLDESGVADAWDILSQPQFDNAIRDCLEMRICYKLNDWAYLQMLKSIGYHFLGKDTNEATLLTAYLYCQSGYQMRLAKDDNHLYLLFASNHKIYDWGYFNIDGINYYPLDFNGEHLALCGASFPNEQPMSLLINESPLFAWKDGDIRNVKSKKYTDIAFSWRCNRNMMDFYNNYPSSMVGENFITRWAIYANTPMEEKLKEQLYPQIRRSIEGLSKKEAVERLLNWIQTGFEYEYDDKVWGADRAFFPEETLYYPYCDCEDRSILLTRLVRDMLRLKCVLVFYPGHLATAVAFDSPVNGDYIQLDGSRFTICDPTYIGAPIGVTMPEMDNLKTNIILLK